MTREDFVTFEIAKKLKEKGYPQHIRDYEYIIDNEYEDKFEIGERYPVEFIPQHIPSIAAPRISEVLKWLRKEHHLHFEVVGAAYGYNLIINDTPDEGGTDRYYSHANDDGPNNGGAWDEYEDCAMYGIEYALDNLI